MRKLLVLLVALVTVAIVAAGSITVTPQITYEATTSKVEFKVPVSVDITVGQIFSGADSDNMTGFYVSGTTGYIWQKLYVSDPLTVTLQLGNYDYPSGYIAGVFDLKFDPITDTLKLYLVPDATSIVDFHLKNSLTFSFLTVDLTIKELLDFGTNHQKFDLGATVDFVKALALENVTKLQASFTGNFDLQASMPVTGWKVSGSFDIAPISGSVSYTNLNVLTVDLKTTVDKLTFGAKLSATATDFINTLDVTGSVGWTTGMISNTLSLNWNQPTQKATLAWALSVSF